MLTSDELIRYSQQIKLDDIGLFGQEKLKSARVLCIGLGGLGSPLLLYLAAGGVGILGIVDDDVIELGNLHRQILYRMSHIGSQKALAAKEQILAINPLIQVNIYPEKLTHQNVTALINQYDIIADCTDNFYTRYLIHDVCFRLEKPYVYASAAQFQGHCSIFYGKKGPCFRCLFPEAPPNHGVLNCGEGGVIGVLTGILGIIQATEIIKWILKIGDSLEKRLLIVDLLKINFKEIQLAQNPDCRLCVHHQVLEESPIEYCPSNRDLKKYAITFEHLNQLLDKNIDINLIDVRTNQEHDTHNIGGKLIPISTLGNRLHELDSKKMTILYCYSGKRSMTALQILLEAGFKSINYLDGGIKNILTECVDNSMRAP